MGPIFQGTVEGHSKAVEYEVFHAGDKKIDWIEVDILKAVGKLKLSKASRTEKITAG